MNAASAVSDQPLLHSLEALAVGDLVLRVASPTRGSTLEIVVERDASLVLKAPPMATTATARDFVASKRSWIYRRLAEKDALVGPPIVKSFVPGEGFAYLGRSYRLTIDESTTEVRLDHGRFVMSAGLPLEGRDRMRRWYIATGQPWLERRLAAWSARGLRRGGRGSRPRIPLGFGQTDRGAGSNQRSLGHVATTSEPDRLRARARTRSPDGGEPHPRVLDDRRTNNAWLRGTKGRARLHRQERLARTNGQ